MKNQRIGVTGGAGFIGSHTVAELAFAGYDPFIIDNFSNSDPSVIHGIEALCGREIRVYHADCRDERQIVEILGKEKPFGIIHFAAFKAVGESVQKPLEYFSNNIGGMISLLRAMETVQINRLVFSSSCTIYGQPDLLPVTENSPEKAASSPYGFTKQVCEKILVESARASDKELSAVMLRYFNPIGAHPSGLIGELPNGIPNNLVPFVTQTAAGWRQELTVYGNDYSTPDGSAIRDYIHVVDLAKAHLKAMEWLGRNAGKCEAFNLGTGKGKSVMEVIASFEKVTGVSLPWQIGPRREGDVEQIWASCRKAEEFLNWKAELTLDEALRDAWKWQQKLGTRP
jgi:UDP-glucose 4-epimerase